MNRNLRITAATAVLASLALAGCATTAPGGYYGNTGSYAPARCYDCGTVERIENVGRTPNATGAVLGGIVGAAAAREIAKDRTDSEGRQNSATIAGAIGGAMAGNAIQNRMGTGYNLVVRMDNGRVVTVMQDDLGPIRVGSYVEVRNGRAYLR